MTSYLEVGVGYVEQLEGRLPRVQHHVPRVPAAAHHLILITPANIITSTSLTVAPGRRRLALVPLQRA